VKLSFTCVAEHEAARPLVSHSARAELERGRCPVCVGQPLEGVAHHGLEWARCPCCQAAWRLEDEGFAVRSGGLVEEWA
jgi:formate dehydrogenase maturation protein FdhE